MDPQLEPLLTYGDVATLLRKSEPAVRMMVSRQLLPVIKLGKGNGGVRFDPKELRAWLDERRHPARTGG